MNPTVVPLLCLQDNYSYLLVGPGEKRAVAVDPGDAEAVQAALRQRGWELAAVLVTHHHLDHVAGIEALVARDPVPVYGSEAERDRIPQAGRGLRDGEEIVVAGLAVTAVLVPGHTLGHLVYRCADALFTGDTLFLGGCGRLFEGSAAQLHDSLSRKLLAFPDATRVYPGHEYTLRTRSFCLSVDPENTRIQGLLRETEEMRGRGESTVPGLLGTERATNVFLRCSDPAVVKSVRSRFPDTAADPLSVFARLRKMMDSF